MNATLLASLGAGLEWLGRSSLQAAVLVLLVLLVQWALRRQLTAAWRYRLWLLVVVRLVWPFTPESGWSIFNLFPGRSPGQRTGAAVPLESRSLQVTPSVGSTAFPPGILHDPSPVTPGPSAGEVLRRRATPIPTGLDAGRVSPVESGEIPTSTGPADRPAAATPAAAGANRFDRWSRWLPWLWLVGFGGLLLRWTVVNLGFLRRLKRDQSPASERVRRLFEECRAAMGLRRSVRVVVTSLVRSPALYGVWRPTLLLPRAIESQFPDERLRHVLLHELGHIRRNDPPVEGLIAVLQALHWFNPLLWHAFRRMRMDRELATDALALSVAGETEARSYGETIVRMLESLSSRTSVPSVVGMLEDRGDLRDRLRRIAGFRKPTRWSLLAAVPVAVLALVTLTEAQTKFDRPRVAEVVPAEAFAPVDLSGHIVTPWHSIQAGSSWDAVPKGRQTISGVPFDLAGLVEVAGTGGLEYHRDHPTRANAIRVGRKVAALHLFHGAGFAAPDGTAIARLVLHFGNGQSRELPIRYGEHVRNWWDESKGETNVLADAQTRVGWTGTSRETDAFKTSLRLFHTRFPNPLPDQVLESVDLVSTLSRCSEVVLGMTTEAPGAPVPPAFAVAAGQAKGAGAEFYPVPLKKFCTRTYEVIDQDPDSSWAYAPHGQQVFNGVLFDLPGVMEVSGLGAARDNNPLPTSIRDIPLGRKARRLHLLHGGAADLADGTPLAKLVVHYEDGREHTLRLVYGVNVRNWYKGGDKRDDVSDPNTRLGWTGDSPRSRRFGSTLRIYHTAFDLPWPEVGLKSVDFVSLMSESVSVVPAMTLETGGSPAPLPAAPAVASASAVAGAAPVADEVLVRVLDDVTGRPVEGAAVRLRMSDGQREYRFGEQKADGRGDLRIDVLGRGPKNRVVSARAPGYLAAEVALPNGTVPKEIMVRLKPGVRIGGVITDAEARPVADATVRVRGVMRDDAGQFVESELDAVTTDAAGRWTTASIPGPPSGLSFHVEHPEFLAGDFDQAANGSPATNAITTARLLAAQAGFVLERAPVVAGRVAVADGDLPVANAEVVVASGENYVNRRFGRTGVDGRFRIVVPELGPAQVLVQAPGVTPALAPNLTALSVERELAPLRVSMAKGRKLRGRVEDEAGRPVGGATVYVGNWQDVNLLTWRVETDSEGVFVWDAAPREAFRLVADKVGFRQMQSGVGGAFGDTESRVTLRLVRGLVILGKAIDGETRKAVDEVSIMYAWGFGEPSGDYQGWELIPHNPAGDGRFSVTALGNRGVPGDRTTVKLLVTAPGYLPAESEAFPGSGQHEFTVELKKGLPIEGVVVDREGRPAPGAEVGMLGIGYLFLQPDGLKSAGTTSGIQMNRAGADGRFRLPRLVPSPWLVAVHPTAGCAEIGSDSLAKDGKIVLQPWGRIEGVLRRGERLGTNEWVMVTPLVAGPGRRTMQYQFEAYRARTGERDGRFVFTHVPPGPQRIVRLIPMGENGWMHSHPLPVDVKAGETTQVTWGGRGRPVVGRVVASDPKILVDWTSGHSSLSSRISLPRFTTSAEAQAWFESAEGKAVTQSQRQMSVEFAKDGSFRIEDVEAGDYTLHLNFIDPESQKTGNWISLGWAQREVAVPVMPGGRSDEPLDIGEIVVTLQSAEAMRSQHEADVRGAGGAAGGGDLSDEVQTLGHGAMRLGQYESKVVLMAVWSTTNAVASTALLKEIEQLRAAMKGDDRFVVLGMLVDNDYPTAQGIVRDLDLKWPQVTPTAAQKTALLSVIGTNALPAVALQSSVNALPQAGLRGEALRQAVVEALKQLPSGTGGNRP